MSPDAQEDDFNAAAERLNGGAEIPTVALSLIERILEAVSPIPREHRQRVAIGFGAFATVNRAEAP